MIPVTSTPPPDTLTCPVCGQAGKPGQKFCNRCGVPLVPAAAATCPRCGAPLKSTSRFCPDCGASAGPQPLTATPGAAPLPASPAGKPAGSGRTLLIAGAVILVAVLAIGAFVLFSGSTKDTPAGTLSGPSSSATPTAGQPVHGTITTGPMTPAAQGTISAGGGTVMVSDPGSAISGLVFTAPAGAYPAGQQVTISSAPITGNTFGNYCTPATPMISINAGDAYAEEIVTVKIPVTIPEGHFAMAFYYDEANQKLEGIPTEDRDSTSVTIATRHFSKVFVSVIPLPTLDSIRKADSGYRPGVDDWEFTNIGSEIARNGHCAGQAVTSMWYYTEQRLKNNAPPLSGRFDNNGRGKTPLFERDNTRGYRFASIIHATTKQNQYFRNITSIISNVSDYATLQEFKYSILLTGEPQFVGIRAPGSGHAIVCYEVADNHLYVADPNYPGKERLITLNENTNRFDPYSSGADALEIGQGRGMLYYNISYIAKSAMFSWPKIAAYYKDVESGSIGFSEWWPYRIDVYSNDQTGAVNHVGAIELAGNNEKVYRFEIEEDRFSWKAVTRGAPFVKLQYGMYKDDGTRLNDQIQTLKEGSNIYAIEVYEEGEWLGFNWIEIVHKPKDSTPAPTLQATRGLTTARAYVQSDAARGDPDCRYIDNVYADTSCVAVGTPGGGFWNTLPFCGSPPDKCIDTRANSGLKEEYTYYTREETDQYSGKSKLVSVRDGWDLHYDSNWGVSSKEFYKDGSQVGSCYLVTSPSTSWSCEGETS